MAPAHTACAVEDDELPVKHFKNPIKHPIPLVVFIRLLFVFPLEGGTICSRM